MKTKIKVLDSEITVDFCSPGLWSSTVMGKCNIAKEMILVDIGMPPSQKAKTFLHELTHYICDGNSIEVSEQSVDGISLGFHSFLVNNPKFVNYLIEAGVSE